MSAKIICLQKFEKNVYSNSIEIDTTSGSGDFKGLSPFILGPIYESGQYDDVYAEKFENLWQYSKVYSNHIDPVTKLPNNWWYSWRKKGFESKWANRYPMGKDKTPLFTFWDYQVLSHIEARKRVYAPLYAKYVMQTNSFKRLQDIVNTEKIVVLRDFDAYDLVKIGKTLVEAINDPSKKFGHTFVLQAILEGKLDECVNSEMEASLKEVRSDKWELEI